MARLRDQVGVGGSGLLFPWSVISMVFSIIMSLKHLIVESLIGNINKKEIALSFMVMFPTRRPYPKE